MDNSKSQKTIRESVLRQLSGGPMFAVAVWSLFCFAGVLHLHELPEYDLLFQCCLFGALIGYLIMFVETVVALATRQPGWYFHLLFCLLPPLRLGKRDQNDTQQIWLPRTGWIQVNETLQTQLEKAFGIPMIVIALLVLPLMALEHFAAEHISANSQLALFVSLATALIWFAFALEFIVIVSIVEKKIAYIKSHWIDLAVILLPLIAFLRVMRLGQLGRLGRLVRMQQLTKTSRIYRMRGLLMKTYRALLLIEAINRLINGSPEKQLRRLKASLVEKEEELQDFKKKIAALEASLNQTESVPLKAAA